MVRELDRGSVSLSCLFADCQGLAAEVEVANGRSVCNAREDEVFGSGLVVDNRPFAVAESVIFRLTSTGVSRDRIGSRHSRRNVASFRIHALTNLEFVVVLVREYNRGAVRLDSLFTDCECLAGEVEVANGRSVCNTREREVFGSARNVAY